MSYKILPTKEFEKDFKKLDKFFQERIKRKIEEVTQNPERCELPATLVAGVSLNQNSFNCD